MGRSGLKTSCELNPANKQNFSYIELKFNSSNKKLINIVSLNNNHVTKFFREKLQQLVHFASLSVWSGLSCLPISGLYFDHD